MDSIFGLGEAQREAFLRHMMHSFGSTHICLWSYSPLPFNCLKFLDGIFQEESKLASSSSGSFGRCLFDAYCETLHYVDLGNVPGFAFKNSLTYMEMELDCLQTIAHTEMQLHFYQGAGIKTLVFMGCAVGEIELGFSIAPQVNLEMEMRNWFPMDFSRQTYTEDFIDHLTNQTLIPTSSSSLSLDSNIEIDCPCSPSSLFNIPTTTSFITEPVLETNPNPNPSSLTLIQNSQVPTIESEDGAMARAILAALSSSTSSSCSQNAPPISHGRRAAFTRYRASPVRAPIRKQRSLFGRAVLFYRELNTHEEGKMPTATQMYHVIQERRRREKLNVSFQVLKTLLPQLSKKDKASVLSSTTEYLTSLKSQVEELTKRNQILVMQLSTTQRERLEDQDLGFPSSSTERVRVELIESVSPSTFGERLAELRVMLRSRECRLSDLVSVVLKMLQQQTNISLCHMQCNTLQSTHLHALIFTLKVEGNDFDGCGFEEAVRRVVGELPN